MVVVRGKSIICLSTDHNISSFEFNDRSTQPLDRGYFFLLKKKIIQQMKTSKPEPKRHSRIPVQFCSIKFQFKWNCDRGKTMVQLQHVCGLVLTLWLSPTLSRAWLRLLGNIELLFVDIRALIFKFMLFTLVVSHEFFSNKKYYIISKY